MQVKILFGGNTYIQNQTLVETIEEENNSLPLDYFLKQQNAKDKVSLLHTVDF